MFILKLFSFLLILTIWACGEDSGGSRYEKPIQGLKPAVPVPSAFNTRLNKTLAIQGKKCRGDETTESFGRGAACLATQYLVYVDDLNTCSESGICTDSVVIPVVAELLDIEAHIPGTSVFEIIPRSPVTGTQKGILKSVYLNSYVKENARVRFK